MRDVTGQLKAHEAKKLIRAIAATGVVFPSKHALERMAERDVELNDILNTLRGGVVQEAELQVGGWTYQVRTQKFTVVVAFRSETRLSIVTAMRHGS